MAASRLATGRATARTGGPDRSPRKSMLRAVLLQALAGAQWRGKGKQLVKAAAMNRHPYR